MDPTTLVTALPALGGGGALVAIIAAQYRTILTLTARLAERADAGTAKAEAEAERLRAEVERLRRDRG